MPGEAPKAYDFEDMNPRLLLPLLAIICVLGFAAVACSNEDPPPVLTVDPQADVSPAAVVNTTVVLPQVARDGPEGTFHYTVVAGDTVYSLAIRFHTTVARIVELNGLDNAGAINVGQVLIMPLAPTVTATTAKPMTGAAKSSR